jgi:Ni/Co efflux regulator RcnB
MTHTILIAIAFVLATALALPVPAAEAGAEVIFSQDEIRIISAWYRDHDEYLPRSGAKHEAGKSRGLPPGIAKNLARGKPLPPGIARQGLPESLIAELPPAPRGYDRVIVDGKVVLVEIATQIVHDVLSEAVLH